jgi:aromatic ring hydroxylase
LTFRCPDFTLVASIEHRSVEPTRSDDDQHAIPAAADRQADEWRRIPRIPAPLQPQVYVDGELIESVADAPALQPGINALAVTYDFALDPAKSPLMTAVQANSGRTVNRMLHINESAGDLLNKLEAVRLLCQETGCAQRYLAHDALNAIHQVSARIDDACGSNEHRARFAAYLEDVQDAIWRWESP